MQTTATHPERDKAWSMPIGEIDVGKGYLFEQDLVEFYFERLRKEDPIHLTHSKRYGDPRTRSTIGNWRPNVSRPTSFGFPSIDRQGRWRGLDDVEFATLTYVDWFNHQRLHGEITDDARHTTPADFEATYYRHSQPAQEAVTQ